METGKRTFGARLVIPTTLEGYPTSSKTVMSGLKELIYSKNRGQL